MRKILVLLVILAFVLMSCAKETKVTVTSSGGAAQQKPAAAAQQAPATTASQAAATPNVAALEQDGMSCLEPGVRVCRPINLRDGKVGDTVGFAFGMSNLLNLPTKFAIKLKFVNTQQSVGQSAIEADKDYMISWLAVNDLEAYYELQPGENMSKPILVKIGDMVAEGKPTPPGTYVFEIQAQTYDNGFYENYEPAQKISVRVK